MLSSSQLLGENVCEKLLNRMRSENTLVCVGLDPDPSKFPDEILCSKLTPEGQALRFLKEVVDITHKHVCSYKIQKAFYFKGFNDKSTYKNCRVH